MEEGILNSFFWGILKKNTKLKQEIGIRIKEEFGGFDEFKKQFSESALNLFGSGWTWLVIDNNNKLKIVNTQGHENPITNEMTPLLVLDVWEHAYYLKYQNKRADYIEAFFNLINWDKVNENFINAIEESE